MKMEMQISDEQIFFIAYCTRSWWRVIFRGCWIFKYDTIPEKYSSKIFISFLSSGSTFSFSVKVILSFLIFSQLGMASLFSRTTYFLPHVQSQDFEKVLFIFSYNILTQMSLFFIRSMWWYIYHLSKFKLSLNSIRRNSIFQNIVKICYILKTDLLGNAVFKFLKTHYTT